ncbi:MAG: 2-oxoacid:ferredoxin oxidoreductase subunit gamma [Candidatus Bathyarchaeota archaeon]|nr:2-oxoacid:ferredoxin oxidoreductase subunit gamma [Candidatus Bathyarchaeota archaeon]
MKMEIRFAGFGGQGIIRSGLILSMAACIYGDKNAVQTQSYGPESRGGSCKSEVIVADTEIDFPLVDEPDVLVIMSQEAYRTYVNSAKKGATILIDPEMVTERDDPLNSRIFDIPATKTAKEIGKTIVANVVMLGALTSLTELVKYEEMKEAILHNIPKGTEELNILAFEKGYSYGKELFKKHKWGS